MGHNTEMDASVIGSSSGIATIILSNNTVECYENLSVPGTITSPTINGINETIQGNQDKISALEDSIKTFKHYIVEDIIDCNCEFSHDENKKAFVLWIDQIYSDNEVEPVVFIGDENGNKIVDLEIYNAVCDYDWSFQVDISFNLSVYGIYPDETKNYHVYLSRTARGEYSLINLGQLQLRTESAQYADKEHTHSDYAPVNHSHDSQYAAKNHTHDYTSLKTEILKSIYPVGAIYTSMNSTSPATVFGFGSWTQIKDRFLYCTTSSKSTGGSKKITIQNLPAHTHNSVVAPDVRGNPDGSADSSDGTSLGQSYWRGNKGKTLDVASVATSSTGSGTDYMPPYMTVYAWHRTA